MRAFVSKGKNNFFKLADTDLFSIHFRYRNIITGEIKRFNLISDLMPGIFFFTHFISIKMIAYQRRILLPTCCLPLPLPVNKEILTYKDISLYTDPLPSPILIPLICQGFFFQWQQQKPHCHWFRYSIFRTNLPVSPFLCLLPTIHQRFFLRTNPFY